MKKLTTLLLTLLMVFTLIGCNSKKEEPTSTIEEPVVEKQEEEVKQEEPVILEEPKEETTTKEEVKTKEVVDPSIYDYWVVVYDQYGNELSRTTAHYGTIVKDPDGKDVKVLTNTYFHTTVNYPSSKKKDGGGSSGPTIDMPAKGDIIYLNEEASKPYRVLKVDGTQVKLLAMYDNATTINFNDSNIEVSYLNSNVDNYLTGDFYDSLSTEIKNAIVPQEIIQYSYELKGFEQSSINNDYYNFEITTPSSNKYNWYEYIDDSKTVGQRNVFTLGMGDIVDYIGNVINVNDVIRMFYNKEFNDLDYSEHNIWLSSFFEDPGEGYYELHVIWIENADFRTLATLTPDDLCVVRPAFVINLAADGIEWSAYVPQQK